MAKWDKRVWFGNVHRRTNARFHLPSIDFRRTGRAVCGAQIFHADPSAARGQRDGARTSKHDVAVKDPDTGETIARERFGAYERTDFVRNYPGRRCEGCDEWYKRGLPIWRD